MDATFLTIIPVAVWAYGAILGLALTAGYIAVRIEAQRHNLDLYRFWDLCFYSMIAAIVGSRLFYILVAPDQFGRDPLALLKFWQGGLVFYGGLLSALTTALIYLRRTCMPVWESMDVLAPALALGQSIWYSGCFLTGYRYDRLSGFPWTMVFEDPHTAMIWGVPLHSDQLLTAAVSLGLFAFVWRKRKGKRFDGELFWLYILLDSLSRVLSTHLQADVHDGLTARAFLVSQIMGGILIATAVFMLTTLKRRPLQRCSQAAGEHAQESECKPEQAPDDQEK